MKLSDYYNRIMERVASQSSAITPQISAIFLIPDAMGTKNWHQIFGADVAGFWSMCTRL